MALIFTLHRFILIMLKRGGGGDLKCKLHRIFFFPPFRKLLPKPEFTVHLSSFLPVTSFVDPRFRAKRYRGCWIINVNNAPRPSIKSHFPEHYMIPKELKSSEIRGNV